MKNDLKKFSHLLPETDYQAIMSLLKDDSHPRRKIGSLQKEGKLLRLKKGFYVLDKELVGRPYSPEVVANLLYGPSYLSLEYALSYYSLIPERVEAYTSVTSQKNKVFRTPIGTFPYRHLASTIYPLGVTIASTPDQRNFLIATPEKALMDVFTLKFEKSSSPSLKDVEEALIQDLRIDLTHLKKILNPQALKAMQLFYRNRHWNKLAIDFLLHLEKSP